MGHDESSVGAAGGPPEFDETLGTSDQTSPRSPGGGSGGAERAGESIGPYRLVSQIGEGGFGVVWLAERREPIVQRVALKIIKAGMDTRAVVARFEQERQALAVMEHPNIAKVFDAGTTPAALGSRPYFVMEHVKGEPITEYCDRLNMSIRDRLELFIPVCEAVQHAHMKGVIHRDIKPSNILVASPDVGNAATGQASRPVPKVIDFGVAKAISQTMTEKTIFTEMGVLIGTPEYMSPEQAEMGATDIDTRTDVYSLGVVLYELLTGALPFDRSTLRSVAYDEIRRLIREVEPPRPSTKLTTMGERAAAAARKRDVEPGSLVRELRRELEWVPLKAMRKDRSRRYATPANLGADIGRYLKGLPLEAAPELRMYRFWKFVRRNRPSVAAVVVVGLVLFAGMFGTAAGWKKALAERAKFEQANAVLQAKTAVAVAAEAKALASARAEATARLRAEAINEFIRGALMSSDPNQGGNQETTIAEGMASAIGDIDSGVFKDQPEVEASLLLAISEVLNGNARSNEALALAERAMGIFGRLRTGDDLDVARSVKQVGSCLMNLGRSAEALPKLEAATAMRRRLLGDDHLEIAMSLLGEAQCLGSLGRSKDAMDMYAAAAGKLSKQTQSIEDPRSFLAENRHAMMACFDGWGEILESQLDSPEKARAVLKDLEYASQSSLKRIREELKGDHPDLAIALNGLGQVRLNLESPSTAEPLLLEALEIRLRWFKRDHPSVAESLNNLARCRLALDRMDEAATDARKAVEMYERLYKGGHPRRANAIGTLARVLHKQGTQEEARELIRQAEEMVLTKEPAAGPNAKRVLEAKKEILGEESEKSEGGSGK